jgi:hypothetical protein
MDDVAAIVERLERIDRRRRDGAQASELPGEPRELLGEAEAWSPVEGGEAGERAVERLRAALEPNPAAAV